MLCKVRSIVVATTLATFVTGLDDNGCYAEVTRASKSSVKDEQNQPLLTNKPLVVGNELAGGDELAANQGINQGQDAVESEDFPGQTNSKATAPRVSKGPSAARLPRFFGGIVDQQQRLQIQEIQLQFRDRITELDAKLKALRQEELQAMEQVLTASQRKLLEKKRQESRPTRIATSKSPVSEMVEAELSSEGESSTESENLKDHPDPTEKVE